jgi:Flp pilus assembly protein TadG
MGKSLPGYPRLCPPPPLRRVTAGPTAGSPQARSRGITGNQRVKKLGPVPDERTGMKPIKRLVREQQGAAALEFALIAPLFLILLFGALDFGLALYAKGLITHASQEGARYGTIYHLSPPTVDDIQGYVQSYLSGAGFSQPVTITVTGAGGASGTPLAVRVDYTHHFLGLPSFLCGWADSLNLSAETVKRLE